MKKLLSSHTYKNDILKIISVIDLKPLYNKIVLITGGLGLIGSAVIDILLVNNKINEAKTKIIVADINEKVFYNKYSFNEYLSFIKYDANYDTLDNFSFDYLICAAGIANPELYVTNPVETITSNVIGLINLLRRCLTVNPNGIVYLSSSEVYGKTENGGPYHENDYGKIDIDNIRSCYAVAKKACEMICKSFSSEFGLNCVVARPGHIYGPSASKNDKRVSSIFCHEAASGKNIVLKSSGKQIRSYCYSLDCAYIILKLLINGKKGESYNIGSSEPISIYQMASFIAKYAGVCLETKTPSEKENVSFNPMDDSSMCSDKIHSISCDYFFDYETGFSHTIDILKEISK